MTKHTSGEWYLHNSYGNLTVRTLDREIARVLYYGGSEDPEVYANGLVLAAASDLLEALEGLLPHARGNYDAEIKAVRAIAKAKE